MKSKAIPKHSIIHEEDHSQDSAIKKQEMQVDK